MIRLEVAKPGDFLLNSNDRTIVGAIPPRYTNPVRLGAGGMGAVYAVHDTYLAKDVAIKMLVVPSSDPEILTRFQREAKLVSSLNHPNIVSVLDFGISEDNKPYMVMEYIKGKTLDRVIKESHGISVHKAMPVFVQICAGLVHAHERDILHRDVKPSNIIVTALGDEISAVKILDFGLAKTQAIGVETITKVGTVMGSPLYLSPEQALCQTIDQRSDIYSFGCLMYETLSGRPPFKGENALDTIAIKQRETAPLLDANVIPVQLVKIVARCLATKAQDRYQTMVELFSDLHALEEVLLDSSAELYQTWVTPQVVTSRSNRMPGVAAGLVVILAVGAVFGTVVLQNYPSESESAGHKSSGPGIDAAEEASLDADSQMSALTLPTAPPRGKGTREMALRLAGVVVGDSILDEIRKLEEYRKSHSYNFAIDNELRDLYLRMNQPAKSMVYSDSILKESVFDQYAVDCLSGWSRAKDPRIAYKKFMVVREKYGHLKYLDCACLIGAAEAAAKMGQGTLARSLYGKVARQKSDPDLARYAALADARLKQLRAEL
jgi:serine/threonine protein kinase